jgi:putative phosphoribosyl transferase
MYRSAFRVSARAADNQMRGGGSMRFRDRFEAGKLLADQLTSYADRADVQVLALPRGGVPVAYEVACRIHALLDVWVVRKLGAPGIPELAMAAIAPGGVVRTGVGVPRELSVTAEQVEEIVSRERCELQRRETVYREDRPPSDVHARTVILIDDGVATGATMRAAIAALRRLQPAEIVVAVPVAARVTCELLAREADRVVCAWTPLDLNSVGEWYEDFSQTTDEEVCALLKRALDFMQKPDSP